MSDNVEIWKLLQTAKRSESGIWLSQADSTEISDAAYEQYMEGNYPQAIRLFKQAVQIAEDNRDVKPQVHNKIWAGECLYQAGRLKEALSFLLEAESLNDGNSKDYFDGIIIQFNIAVQLPLPLTKINRILMRISEYINTDDFRDCRPMYLAQKAELYKYRGMNNEEIETWLEAIANYIKHPKNYDLQSFYLGLFGAYYRAKDISRAEKAKSKYEEICRFQYKEEKRTLHSMIGNLEMLKGNHDKAWNAYLEAYKIAEENKNNTQKDAIDLIDCGFELVQMPDLRPFLIELSRLRHSESKLKQRQIYRCFANYYKRCCTSGSANKKNLSRMNYYMNKRKTLSDFLNTQYECACYD